MNLQDEQKLLAVMSIILIVFILLSAGFFMALFDKSIYDKTYQEHGVYDELGVRGARKTTDYLINYLTSENTEINKIEHLFEPEELSHLEDVKNIFSWLKALAIASLVLLFAFLMRLRTISKKALVNNIRRILLYSGAATLAVLLIVLLASLNFQAFFDFIHKLLFPQGNYTFPSGYMLIKLFPQEFFAVFARKMLFHSAIMALVLLFLGFSVYKK